jgi:general secretion pathway protein B
MSYILEALKKSDQKRQKGQVPDLSTVQIEISPEEKKKALWPYILMGILFLNAVVLAVVILPDKSIIEPQAVVENVGEQKPSVVQAKQTDIESQSTHALSPVTPENSLATVVPIIDEIMVASQEESRPVLIKEVLAEVSIVHEPTIKEANVEQSKDVNIDTNQNELQAEPIQEVVAESIIEEVVKDIPEQEYIIDPQEDSVIAAEPELVETTTLPGEQLKATEVKPIPQHTAPETSALDEEKTRAQREPLHIMQLPSSIQEKLPEFHISAHVYFAKKPASRLASINGKILREGHKLDSDLKVEEITSDGVIFSYHQYLFHVPIL